MVGRYILRFVLFLLDSPGGKKQMLKAVNTVCMVSEWWNI